MSDTPRTDESVIQGLKEILADVQRAKTTSGDPGPVLDALDKSLALIARIGGELAEANQRIRELTEWRPMEDASEYWRKTRSQISVLDEDGFVWQAYRHNGKWYTVEYHREESELKGWLPLPKKNP